MVVTVLRKEAFTFFETVHTISWQIKYWFWLCYKTCHTKIYYSSKYNIHNDFLKKKITSRIYVYIMLSMQYSHLHVNSTCIHSFQSRKYITNSKLKFHLFSFSFQKKCPFQLFWDCIWSYSALLWARQMS